MDGVYTSYQGDNSLLIAEVSKIYLSPGMRIADPTFGKGVFWRKVDLGQYDFHRSDLITCPDAPYDFRNLPYADDSFDVVVLDPPYVHTPGKMYFESRYQNSRTTKGFYHADITDLYLKGAQEARRILRDGGRLWVKCKDEIESSRQCWSHCELSVLICSLGFYAKDLFILTQKSRPHIQRLPQRHARKNHSYLWIFEKQQKQSISLSARRSPS